MKGGPIGTRLPDGRIVFAIARRLDVSQPYVTPLTLLRTWSEYDHARMLLVSTGRIAMLRAGAIDFGTVARDEIGRQRIALSPEHFLEAAESGAWGFAAIHENGEWRSWQPLDPEYTHRGARVLAQIEDAAARIARASTALDASFRASPRVGARLRQEARADMTDLQAALAGSRSMSGPERGTPLHTVGEILKDGFHGERASDLASWVQAAGTRSHSMMRNGIERATPLAARIIASLEERLEGAARAAEDRPLWRAERKGRA